MNCNIWGAEGFEEITIRHSKFAGHRFAHQAAPALETFAASSPLPFLTGIWSAREQIVAHNDDDRQSFLRKSGFGASETAKILTTVLDEEGRQPEREDGIAEEDSLAKNVQRAPNRRDLFRRGRCREAAPEARLGQPQAARCLC